MEENRVVLVSGPSGAGKSTVARRLAEQSPRSRAVHLHADDFYAYIRKGRWRRGCLNPTLRTPR
ncbi:AAA family ATPase [Comamonas sp. JC664]|uniref:AAA family ATPase n=1 Tax=Comamonas sp. JC664 TaxID=2801917 RepID=UPI00191D47AF|nr:AAA family ATPase [Comamonas sp. JC664]